MADQKITELDELTAVATSDLLEVVDDPSGSPVSKKATVANVVAAGVQPLLFLHSEKSSADTPDDDFAGTSLNGKWTAVSGSSGTVDLLETGNVAKYQIDDLLMLQVGQSGAQAVELRQDYTLPDAASIVLAVSPAFTADGGISNNELQVGISLNDSDTSWDAGDFVTIMVDTATDGMRVICWDGTTVFGSTAGTTSGDHALTMLGRVMYFRLHRSSLTYYAFLSLDGTAWVPLGSHTEADAADNVWIYAECGATFGDPVPIQVCHWIRQGTANLDPWSWR